MPFRYLRDPLFLAAVLAYFVNRFVFKRLWADGFVHAHFNDLICVPIWAPVVALGCRICRVRDDVPPQPWEVLILVVVWSILFEVVLPQHPDWSRWATGDPADVAYYLLGAILASAFWRWRYAPRKQAPSD